MLNFVPALSWSSQKGLHVLLFSLILLYDFFEGSIMKFCIYSPSERIWGGGQIYIENLCRYLNSQGTSAKIMTSEPESFSCPTITMASVARKSDRLKGAFTAAEFLKSEGASVVVLNDLSSLWLAPIFRFYGLKVVSLLHLYLQKRNATGSHLRASRLLLPS